jgi:phage shock protein C
MPTKTLYRSTKDKKIAGVIGGLAAYFDQDVNLMRLLATLVIVFSGFMPGLIVYGVAALVIPEEPTAGTPVDL